VSELNKMKPQLKSSAAARALIKRFEPFNGTSVRAADGRWVIGYGHRAAAKPGAEVTPEEADLLLIYDVLNAETAIDDVVNTPLKTPQRDALVSFVHDIGGDAFKRSDVARYLFEGRAMAAGEALAIYGDTQLDRREAENALFMTAFAPPASKRAEEREQSTVELVIKVEHPDQDVVETPAQEPALAETSGDDALPPPPPSARDIAARRAAEDEISRILVAVGEMPLEALQPVADPEQVEEPIEATPPVMPVTEHDHSASDDTPDIIAEIEVVEALVEPEPASDPAADDTPDDAPSSETETAVEEVGDRSDDDSAADNPASEEQAPAEAYDRSADVPFDLPSTGARRSVFDSYGSSPLTALMPSSRVTTMPDPAPAPDARDEADEPTADSPAVSIPLSAVQDAVDTDPVDEAVHAFDVPAEVSEDAVAQTEEVDGSDPAAAQVIARMSQEIAAQVEPVEQQRGRASVHSYDESLPEGATLGFVIAGELAAHFDDEPDLDVAPDATTDAALEAEAPESTDVDPNVEQEFARLAEVMTEEEASTEPETAPEEAPANELEAAAEPEVTPEMDDEPRFIAPAESADISAEPNAEDTSKQDEPEEAAEPLAEAVSAQEDAPTADADEPSKPETGEVEAAEPVAETADTPDAIVAQVHDVVEQAIAVAGQDSPPPHPSFEAAEASGAVGEIGADETLSRALVHIEDELVDSREVAELDDDFSPADLAGEDDLYTDTRTIEPHKDRSAGWFILVLLAGLTLSVYGGFFTYLEWDRVWGARELTSGAWALIAGSFFSVMALWQLLSIWAEKRKEKAPI